MIEPRETADIRNNVNTVHLLPILQYTLRFLIYKEEAKYSEKTAMSSIVQTHIRQAHVLYLQVISPICREDNFNMQSFLPWFYEGVTAFVPNFLVLLFYERYTSRQFFFFFASVPQKRENEVHI